MMNLYRRLKLAMKVDRQKVGRALLREELEHFMTPLPEEALAIPLPPEVERRMSWYTDPKYFKWLKMEIQ